MKIEQTPKPKGTKCSMQNIPSFGMKNWQMKMILHSCKLISIQTANLITGLNTK